MLKIKIKLFIIIVVPLFLFNSCENNLQDNDFLQGEWKLNSIIINNRRIALPTGKYIQQGAYLLTFLNDSTFHLPTGINDAGGKYKIISNGHVLISYNEWTEVYNPSSFDNQMVSIFNGKLVYTYSKNKLIFERAGDTAIIFKRD